MVARRVTPESWEGLSIEIVGRDALQTAAALGLGRAAVKPAQKDKSATENKRTIVDMLEEVGINGRKKI
jgi:hypothetical protein